MGQRGRKKSRQVAGKEPAAGEGKGSVVMALAGEPGLVKAVLTLCVDWAGFRGHGNSHLSTLTGKEFFSTCKRD
jgi:hypothetical protein